MCEFEMIAKTFQGLEPVLAEELTSLGANNIAIGRRMVSFTGNKEMMYRANFALRTAVRILKPIKRFKATSADEVYEAVKAMDWSQYLTLDTTFAVDDVVYSSEFRHSKYVAYRVKDAIVDQFRERTGKRPNIRVTNPDLRLNIHVAETDCTLSLDSSGESLHRRGYRQETVAAPLNEVLAAGIILTAGWHGQCDFIDPMCGSGTLPIEAALIARNIAPGVYRKGYAFEKWPDFDADLFAEIYNDDSQEREFEHKIYGYDNNREAVAMATRNVKAAGMSQEVSIEFRDFKDFTQPAQKSIIIMNPPYGERISAPDLMGLYRMIGERLKHEFQDGEAWVLSYQEECFDNIGLKPSARIPLYNGPLECELRKYEIFSGKYNDQRAQGFALQRQEHSAPKSASRSYGDRQRGDRQRGDRQYNDRQRGDRQYGDRQYGDRRPYGDRQYNDRPYGDRQYNDRPYGDRPRGDRWQRQDDRKRNYGGQRDFKPYKKERDYDEED